MRSGLNVIVVSFDALRADALGVYGYDRRTSPHIDAFASDSIVFETAYAVAPVTHMSFAAAFTGLLPARSFRDWRITAARTLAEHFEDAGYATAGFMHNAHLSAVRGFDRGFQTYEVFTDLGGSDADVVEAGTAWIAAQRDAPFFVWMHLIDPHNPWELHEASSHLYDPDYEGPNHARGGDGIFVERDPAELRRLRSLYDGEVYASDALFGALLDELRLQGLLERSLLVLTSDHGEELMQHGRLLHGQLYEENLRVPLILHHPDLGAGRRVETVVTHLDLLPTLASLTGITIGAPVDGRDLRRVADSPDPLLALTYGSRWAQASIRRDNLKLILDCAVHVPGRKRHEIELYDLAVDPTEAEDLAPSQPETAQALLVDLFGALGIRGCDELRRGRPGAPDRELEGLDDRARRQLEALGYLEP